MGKVRRQDQIGGLVKNREDYGVESPKSAVLLSIVESITDSKLLFGLESAAALMR
jgi:hypothetical protein